MTTSKESFLRVWLPAAPDLSNALLSSQRQNLYCDVVLQTRPHDMASHGERDSGAKDVSEPATVSAHKVVLAAVSPFFQEEMERLPNNVIRLPSSVDESTMKIIVEWIYGGLKEIQASKELLSRLYAVSEELQLFSLVDALRDWVDESRSDSDHMDSYNCIYDVGDSEAPKLLRDAYDDLHDLAAFDDVEVKHEVYENETNRLLEIESDNAPHDSHLEDVKKVEVPSELNGGGTAAKDRPRKRDNRVRNRKKKKKETDSAPVAVPKVVKKVDIRADTVLSPLVDDQFVFRCSEPACGEVISRDSKGCVGKGNIRLFARRCAKHLWVHHRIVCPSVYTKCKEANCEYAGLDHDLARHTMYKHRKEKIACNICGRLVQENSLKNHIDLMHSDAQDEFTCSVCGKSFSRKHFLTLHENQRHKKGDELVRRCDLCHYETAYKPMLVQHVFSRHNILLPGAKLYTCDICEVFKTPLLKLLNRHKRRKKECNKGANAPEPVSCDLCGKIFRGPHQLKQHRHRMHEDADVSPCPICGEIFRSKSGIKYHLWRVHHQGNNGYAAADVQFQVEKPFRCAYCPHASGLSGNCRKHIARAHPGLEVKWIDLRTMVTAERLAAVSDLKKSDRKTSDAQATASTAAHKPCELRPDVSQVTSIPASTSAVVPSAHTGVESSSIESYQTDVSQLPGLLPVASQLGANSRAVKIPTLELTDRGIPLENDSLKMTSQFLVGVNVNSNASHRKEDVSSDDFKSKRKNCPKCGVEVAASNIARHIREACHYGGDDI